MNSVNISGRITKDTELRFAAGTGAAVCRFTIANNVGFGDKKKTYFFDVVIFGKTAENLSPYLVKGQEVAITGQLTSNSYEGKDGIKRTKFEIIPNAYCGIDLIGNRKFNNKYENENSTQGNEEINAFGDSYELVDDGEMPF